MTNQAMSGASNGGKRAEGASQVDGVVTTTAGVAVANAQIEIWDQQLGGETLIATGTTDARGGFALHYDPGELGNKPLADLSVRVVDPRRNNAELVRSPVIYQAAPRLTVKLAVAAADVVRPSEYDRLLDDARPILGKVTLAELDAHGVEYLANRIKWDARTVAMAAQASKLAAETQIPAAHYYALMRTGLPGEPAALHRLPDSSVEHGLKLAIDRGVIGDPGSGDESIERTLKLYREQSAAALRSYAPAAAVSSLGDMLAVSLDGDRATSFLSAYHASTDRPDELWSQLAERGFDSAQIARLQTDGKLGYLTRQNAPLVARLRDKAKVETAEDLVRAGLYRAEAWQPLIGDATPPQLTAESYAAGLAAQVNLSFPTLVVAEMVRRGEVPVGGGEEVSAFLRDSDGKHAIGVEPVARWDGYTKLSDQAQTGAKLVERLYQLTPSNAAMVALHELGLHSAYDIVRIPRDQFLRQTADQFPSALEAAQVYQKAQAIHTTALHVATTYLAYRGAPNVYALSGTQTKQPPAWSLVPGTPTLEDLLDNMDYCACDACKSVLSPAAYFVELLQLIDVATVPAGTQNPQQVLLTRRPDLQDLLLSCENTNVVLPYIDIVNEILEHFIIHGSLATFHGHDMREDSATADLLADPEYVADAAYDKTKAEVFPHSLPFDMPLAALRLLMQTWSTTLSDALAVFGTAAAARREGLGLDAAELRILTDATFHPLPAYFGLAPATTIAQLNAAIADGKTFCRLTEISYEDLVAILRTGFINPGAVWVPLLTPLQVTLAQLQAWSTGGLTDAALLALIPTTIDPAAYGGDVLAWLRDHRAQIMGLVTLTDVSADAEECSFATVELRFALPDAAANSLTALAYHKLHRFIRLWKQLGWTIQLTDQVMTTLLGMAPDALTDGNLDAAFVALVARIGNVLRLARRQALSPAKLADWLPIWDTAQPVDVRRETLAHLLRLGRTDLGHLIELTGIDPLADDLASDAPSLFGLLDAWAAIKAARLKVVDLDYLLRHRDDGGALAPTEPALRKDLKALRDGVTAVAIELGAPPANADLGYARGKMALVYDAAVVDRFIGLISGATTYPAALVTVEEALPAALAFDPRLAFDPFAKQLRYAGILAPATAAALAAAADTLVLGDVTVIQTQGELDAYIAAFKAAVQGVLDAGAADLHALDLDYPELKLVYDAIAPIADPAAQATALVEQVVPALRGRLQQLALRTSLVALLKLDPDLIDVLTAGPSVLHAASRATAGVLDDFLRLDDAAPIAGDGAFALALDPPTSDDYILYVAAPPGTQVSLALDGVSAIPSTVIGPRGELETAAVVALRAGVLVTASGTVAALPAGKTVALRWRTKGMAKAAIPAARITREDRLADARASLLRLQKAALVLRALQLTPHELHHLAARNVDTAGWLDALDVTGTIAAGALHAQWGRLAWLAWFAQRKADEPEPDTWVGLLEDPDRRTASGARVLAAAAGWTDADLSDVLAHFGHAVGEVAALHVFRQVTDALGLVLATGQTAADLIAWTVDAPDAALITAIKDRLRVRQDERSWRATLQTVNDALRNQRRDALVSYLLHHQAPAPGIDTADKLYEYFLIDVAMDACMQTSRIRQALSTVQLFVTRCLMNLEPLVAAASIRADQWAWMKRYRVWEANRKIFLFPENWLEPELRDNKSSLFRELESELLKSDITDELAEDAYLAYLKKLDEIARLEILGCYLQERQAGEPNDDILHVFGRTPGNTHQYYYRRHEGGYWTPWDKLTLNIEGDFVLPVIWKSQLYVFWLTMVHKPEGADTSRSPAGLSTDDWSTSAKVSAELNLAWGEYYQGKWTSPKSSELKDPIRITGLTKLEPDQIVVAMRTEPATAQGSERLVFSLLYLGEPRQGFTATFTSKNAPPAMAGGGDLSLLFDVELFNYVLLWEPDLTAVTDGNSLREPGKAFKVRVAQPSGAASSTLDEVLWTKTSAMAPGFRVRPLMHPTENQYEAPLFYSDERGVLFVEPTERIESIAHYTGYFWNDIPAMAIPVDKIKIPPLYEQPVVRDPLGPVENPLVKVINPNYERAISGNSQFAYGGVAFDARGIAAKETGR